MFTSSKFLKSLFSLFLVFLIISCSSDDDSSSDDSPIENNGSTTDGDNTDDSNSGNTNDTEVPTDGDNTNDDGNSDDNNMETPVDDPGTDDGNSDTNDNNEVENSFISVWELTDSDKTIVLPIYSGINTNYDFTVDWGDGTTGNVTSFNDIDKSHTYANAGDKTVTITGTITGFNFLMVSDSKNLLKEITAWGDLHFGFESGVFLSCINLTTLPDNSPDLTGITDLTSYFFNCESFIGPVKEWDVTNIQIFKNTFSQNELYNEDISGWNVSSNATSILGMFSGASLFNQDISGWDVSNVTDFSGMFASASLFNQDISEWKVDNATDTSSMFSSANSFNQDISGWNVSNVVRMDSMFRGNLAFNQDISGWDVSIVTRCLNFSTSGAILTPENSPALTCL